jgi:hypothetical protein
MVNEADDVCVEREGRIEKAGLQVDAPIRSRCVELDTQVGAWRRCMWR